MIYIGLANFDKIYLEGRTSPGTPKYDWMHSLIIYKDTRTDNRKLWYTMTGFTYQYLQVWMGGGGHVIDPPSTYFEIGELCVVDAANVISFQLGHSLPYDVRVWRPREVAERRGGGVGGVANLGRRRVQINWSGQPMRADDEEKYNRIVRMDEDQKFIFAENLSLPATPARSGETATGIYGDRSRVYLVRRVGDSQMTLAGEVLEVGMQMEEV